MTRRAVTEFEQVGQAEYVPVQLGLRFSRAAGGGHDRISARQRVTGTLRAPQHVLPGEQRHRQRRCRLAAAIIGLRRPGRPPLTVFRPRQCRARGGC